MNLHTFLHRDTRNSGKTSWPQGRTILFHLPDYIAFSFPEDFNHPAICRTVFSISRANSANRFKLIILKSCISLTYILTNSSDSIPFSMCTARPSLARWARRMHCTASMAWSLTTGNSL
jgi:hypothetical protein